MNTIEVHCKCNKSQFLTHCHSISASLLRRRKLHSELHFPVECLFVLSLRSEIENLTTSAFESFIKMSETRTHGEFGYTFTKWVRVSQRDDLIWYFVEEIFLCRFGVFAVQKWDKARSVAQWDHVYWHGESAFRQKFSETTHHAVYGQPHGENLHPRLLKRHVLRARGCQVSKLKSI